MEHPYNETLFENQKKQPTNMGEPEKCDRVLSEKTEETIYLLYDFIYMKYPEKVNLQRWKID